MRQRSDPTTRAQAPSGRRRKRPARRCRRALESEEAWKCPYVNPRSCASLHGATSRRRGRWAGLRIAANQDGRLGRETSDDCADASHTEGHPGHYRSGARGRCDGRHRRIQRHPSNGSSHVGPFLISEEAHLEPPSAADYYRDAKRKDLWSLGWWCRYPQDGRTVCARSDRAILGFGIAAGRVRQQCCAKENPRAHAHCVHEVRPIRHSRPSLSGRGVTDD